MMITKSNIEILTEMDKKIYGHTNTKKQLINLMRRVDYMWKCKFIDLKEMKCQPLKTLLIGPSGTGKTASVKAICDICGMNFYEVDCSRLAPTGGADGITPKQLLDNINARINDTRNFLEMNGVTASSEGVKYRTIIYLDEIDKLAEQYSNNCNWNKKTQVALLKLLEGDTTLKNVNFIMSGAFTGINKDEVKSSIGFFKEDVVKTATTVEADDLIAYGLMPELVGRINNITVLDELSLEDYENILNTFIVPPKNEYLSDIGASELVFSSSEAQGICETAKSSGQGVRSLIRQIEGLSSEAEFNCYV